MDTTKTFTVAQVAQRWGVKTDTVITHIHAGRLQAFNVGMGKIKPRWRILPKDLEAAERRLKSGPKPVSLPKAISSKGRE